MSKVNALTIIDTGGRALVLPSGWSVESSTAGDGTSIVHLVKQHTKIPVPNQLARSRPIAASELAKIKSRITGSHWLIQTPESHATTIAKGVRAKKQP